MIHVYIPLFYIPVFQLTQTTAKSAKNLIRLSRPDQPQKTMNNGPQFFVAKFTVIDYWAFCDRVDSG